MARRTTLIAAALLSLLAARAAAQDNPAWSRPVEPFRVIGNIYYVGTEGIAVYLIVTPKGDILLDGGMPDGGPLVDASIRKLGFDPAAVRVILNTHAHFDHAGGLAWLKAKTGATLLASPGDRSALENGRHLADNSYGKASFPPVHVDRTLRDGETVRVGSAAMTAHFTPGHTRGCTSWTLPVVDRGRALTALFYCSTTVAGNVLVGNRAYPGIAADYRRSFRRLAAIKADVFLTNHPAMAHIAEKHQRHDPEAFVDPTELQAFVAASRKDFEDELARQAAARR